MYYFLKYHICYQKKLLLIYCLSIHIKVLQIFQLCLYYWLTENDYFLKFCKSLLCKVQGTKEDRSLEYRDLIQCKD